MLGKINFIERFVDASGQKFIVLTATDYPYGNYQVLPWDDSDREKTIAHFGEGMTFGRVEGRDDFGVIIIGASVKLAISQENATAVGKAVIGACHQAAAWWNEHHPLPVYYATLDLPIIDGEGIKTHPTYSGVEPVPIPEEYFEAWKKENSDHDPYEFLKIRPIKKDQR